MILWPSEQNPQNWSFLRHVTVLPHLKFFFRVECDGLDPTRSLTQKKCEKQWVCQCNLGQFTVQKGGILAHFGPWSADDPHPGTIFFLCVRWNNWDPKMSKTSNLEKNDGVVMATRPHPFQGCDGKMTSVSGCLRQGSGVRKNYFSCAVEPIGPKDVTNIKIAEKEWC